MGVQEIHCTLCIFKPTKQEQNKLNPMASCMSLLFAYKNEKICLQWPLYIVKQGYNMLWDLHSFYELEKESGTQNDRLHLVHCAMHVIQVYFTSKFPRKIKKIVHYNWQILLGYMLCIARHKP